MVEIESHALAKGVKLSYYQGGHNVIIGVVFTSHFQEPSLPFSPRLCAEPYSCWKCCRLENRRSLVRFLARSIFFSWIDDSHCDRSHSSLTAVCCFNNGYVGKQPVAWKECCVEFWLKKKKNSRKQG